MSFIDATNDGRVWKRMKVILPEKQIYHVTSTERKTRGPEAKQTKAEVSYLVFEVLIGGRKMT